MTKSIWQASICAPDGSVLSEVFEGERNNTTSWNAANAWLLHEALPKMQMPDHSHCSMTQRAHSRFMDALLSQDGDIVIWCDPWEMRLEHYTAEQIEQLETARKTA